MIFPAGTLKWLYIDRDDVAQRGADAKPWVVEVHYPSGVRKFRGKGVLVMFAEGLFDFTEKPNAWLETYENVELLEGEPF